MKVIIVGAGIMGLCTAWALERRGHEVTVFDQGPVPNPLGSSVDQHRMTRLFYGDLPDYGGPMLDEAFAAYERLWGDLGETLYVPAGVLGLSAREGDWTDLSRRQMERDGRRFEVLTPAEVRQRYPFLAADNIDYGVFAEQGGTLFAERIVAALARRMGRALRPRTRVMAVDPETASVTLTDGASHAADRLVVTAGPWLGALVPEFAGRVISHRQVSVYLAPPEAFRSAWNAAPAIVDFGGDDELYAFPPVAGTDIKIGYSRYKRPGPPDAGRAVAPGEPERIFEVFRPHLARDEEYRILAARSCCYAMTADSRFIIEPLGASSMVANPCSGHGFKFAAAIGLKIAAALSGDIAAEDVTGWAAGVGA